LKDGAVQTILNPGTNQQSVSTHLYYFASRDVSQSKQRVLKLHALKLQ